MIDRYWVMMLTRQILNQRAIAVAPQALRRILAKIEMDIVRCIILPFVVLEASRVGGVCDGSLFSVTTQDKVGMSQQILVPFRSVPWVPLPCSLCFPGARPFGLLMVPKIPGPRVLSGASYRTGILRGGRFLGRSEASFSL